MTNEQATELLALMADQIKATDRLAESFERRFTQLNETMLNGFLRLEDKFDKKTDMLAEEIRGTNQRVDHLTERVDHLSGEVHELKQDVRALKQDVREIKAEAQTTNRRLGATFEQTGRLTEEATGQQARLRQLETEEPSNAELHRRVLALEEQMRRAS